MCTVQYMSCTGCHGVWQPELVAAYTLIEVFMSLFTHPRGFYVVTWIACACISHMVTYALRGRSCNPLCYARRIRGWESCCSLYLRCAFLWPAKFIGLSRLVSRRLRFITTIAAAAATAAAGCSSTRVGTWMRPACLPLAHAAGRCGHQEVPTAGASAAAPRGAQRCSCQPSSCLLPDTAGTLHWKCRLPMREGFC